MQKKLRKDVNISGITSSGMLMRLLATRPSGLTSVEAAKRATIIRDSDLTTSVMRDGFLRLIGADQIVAGDILVLAANEKAPVTIATISKELAVVEAGKAVQENIHGIVLDATLTAKDKPAKVKTSSAFMMAVAALVSFCAVLAVNELVFVGMATLVATTMLLAMVRLVRFVHFKVTFILGELQANKVQPQVVHQIKPVVRAVQKLLVHAGNAEIPQPVLA